MLSVLVSCDLNLVASILGTYPLLLSQSVSYMIEETKCFNIHVQPHEQVLNKIGQRYLCQLSSPFRQLVPWPLRVLTDTSINSVFPPLSIGLGSFPGGVTHTSFWNCQGPLSSCHNGLHCGFPVALITGHGRT